MRQHPDALEKFIRRGLTFLIRLSSLLSTASLLGCTYVASLTSDSLFARLEEAEICHRRPGCLWQNGDKSVADQEMELLQAVKNAARVPAGAVPA